MGPQVPPRTGSGAGRFADGGQGGPSPRHLAELRLQVTFRARGGDVAGRAPVRATTLPPTASPRRTHAGSLPNPRLLLTGALRGAAARVDSAVGRAAAPNAPAAEAQGVRRNPWGPWRTKSADVDDTRAPPRT